MGKLSFEYRLSVSDLGENNELSNKGILRLLQEAAIQASTSVGYGITNINETHRFWLVLNWKLKVFSRPTWNEKVTITTWPKSAIKCYSVRNFEVYNEQKECIAIASSKWVLMNTETMSIMRISEEIVEQYGFVDIPVFDDENFNKIPEPDLASQNSLEYTVQRKDIDTNHHVNNANYLDFAYEALPQDVYENIDFKNTEIMYKHEAKFGDTINCLYTKLQNGEHIVTMKNSENDKIHAIVRLY